MKKLKRKIAPAKAIQTEKLPRQEPNQAERFDAIIKSDFERYKAVFKALA